MQATFKLKKQNKTKLPIKQSHCSKHLIMTKKSQSLYNERL